MTGYKTYIVAGLMAVASALFGLGFIDKTLYEAMMGVLLGGGVAALRSGVSTDTQAVVEAVPKAVERTVPHAVAEGIHDARRPL